MLSDQKFGIARVVALNTEFFRDPVSQELDYGFVLEFSARMFEASEHFAFHFWDFATDEVRRDIEALDAWGCPVLLGKLFPVTPTREQKRDVDRMMLCIDHIWAKSFVATYRIQGHKNISTVPPRGVLLALHESLTNPDPNHFPLTVRQMA